MTAALIKPGIMVSLKSTVTGGVSYLRKDLESGEDVAKEAEARAGAEVRRWETTKVVQDAEEHERATKTRGRALAEIRKFCANTAFGLLCPEDAEKELDEAIAAARALTNEHNDTAKHTRVHIYVLKGRIASTDEEAARAIGEEVRLLMESMNGGIDKLDVESIREAATKAKELEAMLQPVEAEKVANAVAQARKAARDIVRRIQKEGEEVAVVLADIQRGAIEKARIAFLDFDSEPAAVPTMSSMDNGRVAALELSGEPGEI